MERRFITKNLMLIMLIILFLLYAFASTYMISYGFVHVAVVWNLFLSMLPLAFAFLARRSDTKGKSRASVAVFSLLWLVFFPNAPYMVTDFIHVLDQSSYYLVEASTGHVAYNLSIEAWMVLVHVAAGVFCGVIAGLFSLYIMHRLVLKRKGKLFSSLFVVICSLLSGLAIYIGRFLRFNTWDILRPVRLLQRLFSEMSWFALEFSLLMAGFILIVYLFFFLLCQMTGTTKNN